MQDEIAVLQARRSDYDHLFQMADALGVNTGYLSRALNDGKVYNALRKAMQKKGWIPAPPKRYRVYGDAGSADVKARFLRAVKRSGASGFSDFVRLIANGRLRIYPDILPDLESTLWHERTERVFEHLGLDLSKFERDIGHLSDDEATILSADCQIKRVVDRYLEDEISAENALREAEQIEHEYNAAVIRSQLAIKTELKRE